MGSWQGHVGRNSCFPREDGLPGGAGHGGAGRMGRLLQVDGRAYAKALT